MASTAGETSPRIPQSNSSSSSSTSAPRSASGATAVRSSSNAAHLAGVTRSSSSSSSHHGGQLGTPTPPPNPKDVFVENYRRRRGQTTMALPSSSARLSSTVGSVSGNPAPRASMEDTSRSFVGSAPLRSTVSQVASRPVPLPPSVVFPVGPSPLSQSVAMSPFGFAPQSQARDHSVLPINNASLVRSPHMVVTPTTGAPFTGFPSPASFQTPRETGDATHRNNHPTVSDALLRDRPTPTAAIAVAAADATSRASTLDSGAPLSGPASPLTILGFPVQLRWRHPQWYLVYLSVVVCSLFVALIVVQQGENISKAADHVFQLHASETSGSLMGLRLLVEEEKSWIAQALPLLTLDNETVATRLPIWVNTTVSERKESLRRVKDKALEVESLLVRLVHEFVESVYRCEKVGPLHCAALEALTLRELGAAAERRQRNAPRKRSASSDDSASLHFDTSREVSFDSASTAPPERLHGASGLHSTIATRSSQASMVDGNTPTQKPHHAQHSLLVRVGAFLAVVGLVSLASRRTHANSLR